jgi:glycerol-3-phosphate dehydrogenase
MALLERPDVCVIGGGVVGAAVTLALARRGVAVTLLEAERELGLCASGTNSGILHTGFDSTPDTLETRLILRSGALRDEALVALGVPVKRCGAWVGRSEREVLELESLAERARHNGVEVEWRDHRLFVPGESVTDPVRLTLALAGAAERLGARIVRAARVERIVCGAEVALGGADGELARCRVAVNCAGLYGDEVARAAGDDDFRIRPRKGEFVVLQPRNTTTPLDRILLPVPSPRTKGVLVFPTVDGMVIAGPTAHDQDDKRDWRVSPEAERDLVEQARGIAPELRDYEHVFSYAGLRPAGAAGDNYVIERSRSCPRLVHVAAIRSTGLSASLGIAEHVAALVEGAGMPLGPEQPIPQMEPIEPAAPWWRRSAEYWT